MKVGLSNVCSFSYQFENIMKIINIVCINQRKKLLHKSINLIVKGREGKGWWGRGRPKLDSCGYGEGGPNLRLFLRTP